MPTTGTYYFSASANVDVDGNDEAVNCYVTFGARGPASDGVEGTVGNPGAGVAGNAAVVDYWFVNAGDSGQLYCYSMEDDTTSSFVNGGLTVMLVSNSSGRLGTALAPAGSDLNDRPEAKPRARHRKR